MIFENKKGWKYVNEVSFPKEPEVHCGQCGHRIPSQIWILDIVWI